MEKRPTKLKFTSLSVQLRILCGFLAAAAVCLIVLLILKESPSYKNSVAAPLYDARTDVEAARARLGSGEAVVIKSSESIDFKVQLAFSGLAAPEVMERILERLDERNMKAIFFVSGIDAAESGDMLSEILLRGHIIGSRGLRGEAAMQTMTQLAMLDSFCETNVILRDLTGTLPTLLKAYRTEYTTDVLEAAYATGMGTAVDSPYDVDIQSFSSYSSTKRYVDGRALGDFVTMDLSGEVEPPAQDEKPPEADPAVDMQETIPDADYVDMSALTESERVLLISEWLIKANAEADYLRETVALREQNQGAQADPLLTIPTTEKASCYLFSGTGSDAELDAVLSALDAQQAKATFALTREEADASPAQVRAILERGHSVLPRVLLQDGNDFYTICSRMILTQRHLQETYGCPDTGAVAILSRTDALAKEAARAAGYDIVSYQSYTGVPEDRSVTDAQAYLDTLFGTRVVALMRGHILRFERGAFEDAGMLARLVEIVSTKYNIYALRTVEEVLNDTAYRYTYPVPEDKWLSGMEDIQPGHLPTDEERMDAIAYRYIGTPSAKYSDNLPGFTANERGRINKQGKVNTKDRVVFLTFDDWGSDAAITKLLDVLEAHQAEATFYVRTNYVENNPNLLRAIAAAGHQIGSHTDSHMQLAEDVDGDYVYTSLTEDQLTVLAEDVMVSWYKLAGIIGDVQTEGSPALVKQFRPPTLSVSKESLGVILDLGFEYIVSGSYSSHDYEEPDAEALFKDIKANLTPGGIIVMHMSDNSVATPQALELLFAYNEKLPESKQYTFAALGAYLDGTYQNTPPY